MKKYDYLIVGAGLYGAVMAYELGRKGKSCLVIDRRDFTARILKGSMCTNTARISSIPRTGRSGIM